MKKTFFLSFIFLFFLQFNIDVFAFDYSSVEIAPSSAETSQGFPSSFGFDSIPDPIIDDNGHYIRGSIWSMQTSVAVSNVPIQFILGNQFYVESGSSQFPSDNEIMFVINFDGSGSLRDDFGNALQGYYLCWKYIPRNSDSIYSSIQGYASFDSNDVRWRSYNLGSTNANTPPSYYVYPIQYNNFSLVENYQVETNLPIFLETATTSIDNYITNGDISGAINKDQIQPAPVVPYPLNLNIAESSKTAYGSKFTTPVIVDWYSGQDSTFPYQAMCFNVYYQIIGEASVTAGGSTTNYTIDTGIVKAASNIHYKSDHSSYTISTDTLNDAFDLAVFGRNIVSKAKYIQSITIWIENVDDIMRTNVSEMKYAQYDYKTKVESSSNDQIGEDNPDDKPSENGSDGYGSSTGSSSGSGSVNNSPTFNNNPTITVNNSNNLTGGATDNYITSALDGFLNASDTLGQNVHSGFGLLGENGFLAAVGTMFTFVPTEIMTMIGITVAACMLMFVVGSVVWFIRG